MSSTPTVHTEAAGAAAGELPADGRRARRPWREAVLVYREPRVFAMLFLGFASGLPFYLYFQTLSAWLRQSHVALTTIAMLSWAGLFYSLKFLWAPAVDRWKLPGLHRWLGRRRSWMWLGQFGIVASLWALSTSEPATHLRHVVIGVACLSFFGATQDIAMDAWRIESAPGELQGAMVAAYSLGYRVAMLAGSAGALGLAQARGWHVSYRVMAALGVVGIVTTLLLREPHRQTPPRTLLSEARALQWLERRAHWPAALAHAGASFIGAVVCPFLDFFERRGALTAVIVLLLIASYHFTDYAMAAVVNPFYIDHGYSLAQIATVVKLIGISAGLAGVLLAGMLIARLGLRAALALGSLLIMSSNLGFALLAHISSPTVLGLALANVLDNLALAMQGMALIAFLSSLTSPRYTATQYALFTSFYGLAGKVLEGTSGFVVQAIGYVHFFLYSASLSLPPLLLLVWLSRRRAFTPAGAPC